VLTVFWPVVTASGRLPELRKEKSKWPGMYHKAPVFAGFTRHYFAWPSFITCFLRHTPRLLGTRQKAAPGNFFTFHLQEHFRME
jgi:hypothetical protein